MLRSFACGIPTKCVKRNCLLELVRQMGNLQKLDITSCVTLSDISIKRVVDCCSSLCSLAVVTISEVLLKSCSRLTELDVTTIANSQDLTKIAEHCPILSKFRLRTLCTKVDDDEVIKLVEKCSGGLVSIAIPSAQLTDRSWCKLVETSPFLTEVDVSRCHTVTNTLLLTIAKCCKHLTTFSAVLNRQLTDVGVVALAKGCTALRSVDLDDCTALTDCAILNLARCCSKLTRLSVIRCHYVSDAAVFDLVVSGVSLMALRVLGTTIGPYSLLRAIPSYDKLVLSCADPVNDECSAERSVTRGLVCCTYRSSQLVVSNSSSFSVITVWSPNTTDITLCGAGAAYLTDLALIHLVESFPQLKALNVRYASQQVSFASVKRARVVSTLTHCGVSCCGWLD